MEQRNIQRTGGSSFTITLPKDWITRNKLKEKDVVDIIYRESGAVMLQTAANMHRAIKRKIDISGLSKEERAREIVGLYVLGAEEIEVIMGRATKQTRREIRKIMQLTIGLEIVEESAGRILLKNILSPEKFSFQQSIETMFSMAQLMFQDALNAFAKEKPSLAQDVVERDFEIDKLYFLVSRQCHLLLQDKISESKIGFSLERACYYEHIATYLERIADHAVKIAQLTAISPEGQGNGLKEIFLRTGRSLLPLLRETARFTQDIDKNRAHQTLRNLARATKDIDGLYGKINGSGFAEGVIVCDSLDRLRGYVCNMAEKTIDQALLR